MADHFSGPRALADPASDITDVFAFPSRIEQSLMPCPPPKDRVARVPRVVQDRPNGAALPAVREPVPVLVRALRRWARDSLSVQHARDSTVTVAVQVLDEDPLHHVGLRLSNCQLPQPETLGRLTRVRVRPTVHNDVTIRCPPTLVPALVDHLRVHRRPHPCLHVLPL